MGLSGSGIYTSLWPFWMGNVTTIIDAGVSYFGPAHVRSRTASHLGNFMAIKKPVPGCITAACSLWMLMVNLHHQIAFGDISLMILYSLDSSPRAPHCFGCLMGDFLSCGREDSSASLGRPNIWDIPCEFQVQETTEILRFSINTMD